MIVFNKVSYSYDKNSGNAVDELSMSIEQNEWIALIGHNGSGKSTLAKLDEWLTSSYKRNDFSGRAIVVRRYLLGNPQEGRHGFSESREPICWDNCHG